MHSSAKVVLVAAALFVIGSLGVHARDGETYPHWTYDIGAGSGYSTDGAFVEGQIGLNTHFNRWITWRNSGFYRNQPDRDDFFGLDTSLLAGDRLRLADDMQLSYQAGGGYRFTSLAQHAPFAETGVGFRVGGLRLGANAKYLFYELVGDDRDNEFVFGVQVSGRATGRF